MAENYGNHQIAEKIEAALESDRQNEAKRGVSLLAVLALTVMVVVSIIISIVLVMQDNRNQEEIAALKEQIAQDNEKMAEIQHWINSEVDDAYIEKFAKEKGWDFADAKEYLTGK